jgi:carbonic anhydrase/acetyltransferase-like protein (isoleucine patch superfamily)
MLGFFTARVRRHVRSAKTRCRLQFERLEDRELPSATLLPSLLPGGTQRLGHGHLGRGGHHHGPSGAAAAAAGASFTDPTALIMNQGNVHVGSDVYIAPFAFVDGRSGPITIGDRSNVQDNVMLVPGAVGIVVGDQVILAHNATVTGNAHLGATGGTPAFVGFNAVVDGATIEPDAMVNSLARVGPGVTLHGGKKVLPGKFVQTQAQADDPALGKVALVTDADRAFMNGVIHVNTDFAEGYARLARRKHGQAVRGINVNPGGSDFNSRSVAPTLAGVRTVNPGFKDRIIGKVQLADTLAQLARALGARDSIRADEGFPFKIGHISKWLDRVTVHALEETNIQIGPGSKFGFHAVIHGGPDDGNHPHDRTRIGKKVSVGDFGIIFRSTVGDGSKIGNRALVDGSQLAPGTVVPDGAIIVNNVNLGTIEW